MAARRRVAEQHEDWLNLADAEAPWFSLPVLKRAFSNGLDPTPPEIRAEHKARWYGDEHVPSARLAEDRTEYIDWLLRDVLGWGADYLTGNELPDELAIGVSHHEVTITPTGVYQAASAAPVDLFGEPTCAAAAETRSEDGARLLVFALPAGTDPRSRPTTDTWSATWLQRSAMSCRHHGVPLALVTDGDHLTLVHAPQGSATGWGTWRASEFASESVVLDSLRSMLHSRRFIGTSEQDTPEALLTESIGSQAEVTDQLGTQVRRATELLVNAISRADRSRGGELLAGVGPHEVYEAAVTVMMRTVFLLVAEENDLLPIDNAHYQDLYAVRTLRESLQQELFVNPEALETRTTAWHRLLATSRAVHSGVHHEELSVPAYGGNLFDPDRFPFLEGRNIEGTWRAAPGTPIPITDLDVLAILEALLVLRFRSSGGVTDTRRLSYRYVDVEQIGHIYERLLDHDAVVAEHVVLGLKGKTGEEPEIALPDLEAKEIDGDGAVVAWLSSKDAVGAGRRVGTKKQVEKLLAEPVDRHLRSGLIQACQGDQNLAARIDPFANLLRLDLRDRPLVFLERAVYVTETGSRRDSGTAYTTRELAEELAEHTLAPLCYSPGPQDTSDTNEWRIRPSADILNLKVCDPAVGSGAILVAACRYLALQLVHAWREEGDPRAAETTTAADDPNRLDVVIDARRLVAEHCCYGVDRNPMAVEMAKLSMWLTTVAKNRPFTFLDHAIKSGDSLLGIWDLDQLRYLHYDVAAGRARKSPIPGFSTGGDAVQAVERLVDQALDMRREMHSIETIRPADVEQKQKLYNESEARLAILATTADVLAGAALSTAGEKDPNVALTARMEADAEVIVRLIDALETSDESEARDGATERARARLNGGRPTAAPLRQPLHWPIAFPEVFGAAGALERGFDAMVGNPPFIGGQKIGAAAGTDYRNHLTARIAAGKKGLIDLVAYFFLSATSVAKSFGYLATNTIAQGDTSEAGLTQIVDRGWTIHRAVSSVTWPGDATLEIAKVWATATHWRGAHVLDDRRVVGVDEMLYPLSRSGWRKQRLGENADKSFIGSYVLGIGFTMRLEEAQALIDKDSRNSEVLFEYMTGQDFMQSPTQQGSRWIINFFDWPESKARQYRDCFAIVEELVKPERQERKPDGQFKKQKSLAQSYWKYARTRPKLYNTIAPMKRVLCRPITSAQHAFAFVDLPRVIDQTAPVYVFDDSFHLAVLQSEVHAVWWLRHGPTFGASPRYVPSDVFDTFPRPEYTDELRRLGENLEKRRQAVLQQDQIGLTTYYRQLNDPELGSVEISEMRNLHQALATEMFRAYGWDDLDPTMTFRELRMGQQRLTLDAETTDEVLDRLLELNKTRYEAEVAAGLHNRARTPKASKTRPTNQESLLGDDQ